MGITKRIILFDVDGILLLTGKIGQNSARSAFDAIFGFVGNFDRYYPSGRTMEAILAKTLEAEGRPEAELETKREIFYQRFFSEFERRLEDGNHQIKPLPGTIKLVDQLSMQKDLVVGLVTANHHHTAKQKLTTAGFIFDSLLGQGIENQNTFVIGDTLKDIEVAKEAGVNSIIVCTGGAPKSKLKRAKPDFLLENLANQHAVFDVTYSFEEA